MSIDLPGFLSGAASLLPSPSFVIDADRLRQNVRILENVQERTGTRILLALKAFSAWSVFPQLSRAFAGPLWGTCASSVDEARLGREEFGGEVHAFAAAWSDEEFHELQQLADHIVFNSLGQWQRFRPLAAAAPRRIKYGLRVNPEHSEGAVAIYNPCAPGSRLGIRQRQLEAADKSDLAGISGLHFHTLCEQGADALARTLASFKKRFGRFAAGCQWLNWGGGHHITKPGYDVDLLCSLINDFRQEFSCQIYLEPGEAVALDAGWLVATVLDVVEADMPVAILDTSAACHMPDVLEMPYTPQVYRLTDNGPIRAEAGGGWKCRLAGKSCLAGDVIGEYGLDSSLKIGDRVAFADMAIYSMVKTNTFNGLRLPAIAIHDSDANEKLKVIRDFGYEDFKTRLS